MARYNPHITQKLPHKMAGVTLIELVMVMILLGVMAVGVSSFMGLATQTYSNVTSRDELISSARFVVERLNREIRNAVPNSIKVTESGNCIEFLPIAASTNYVDIPVPPEPAANVFTVIEFTYNGNDDFTCSASGCDNLEAIVYPLDDSILNSTSERRIAFDSIANSADEFVQAITLSTSDSFPEHSPVQRMYFARESVKYCQNGTSMWRTVQAFGDAPLPDVLMAENLTDNDSFSVFLVETPTLRRNAIVQVRLQFSRDDENIVFENQIHISNLP